MAWKVQSAAFYTQILNKSGLNTENNIYHMIIVSNGSVFKCHSDSDSQALDHLTTLNVLCIDVAEVCDTIKYAVGNMA